VELLVAMLVVLPLPLVARSMARSRRRAARLAQWAERPCTVTDTPFRGYKLAQLVVSESSAWLVGVLSVRYGVDENASCLRRGCSPPGLDCLCGFYAFADRRRAVDLLDRMSRSHPHEHYVLLTADLDGDVLEYELGYRAERQRIVRIEIADECVDCRGAPDPQPVVALLTHPRFRSDALRGQRDLVTHSGIPNGSSPLRPLCARHLPSTPGTAHTLSTLRGLVGTEVTRLPDSEAPRGRQAWGEAA
jgi:hypothetical protein